MHKADVRNLYTDSGITEPPQVVIQDQNDEENSFMKKSSSNGTEMTNLAHSVKLPGIIIIFRLGELHFNSLSDTDNISLSSTDRSSTIY